MVRNRNLSKRENILKEGAYFHSPQVKKKVFRAPAVPEDLDTAFAKVSWVYQAVSGCLLACRHPVRI